MADKDAFYALSRRTGATDRDSAVDIDGGFGTLLSYASKARRELPDDTVVLDGPVEPLGKRRHVRRPAPLHPAARRRGADQRVQLPGLGLPGEAGAGLPRRASRPIVKPASQTAYLTEAVVRRIVESGLLPEGSVQLLSGSAAGLLDQLGGQDLVFFTGSAATARKLRSTPRCWPNSVRFNAEADSLNCSVLGPDATAGHPRVRPVRRGSWSPR